MMNKKIELQKDSQHCATVSEMLNAWLKEQVYGQKSSNTHRCYELAVRRIQEYIGTEKLNDVDEPTLQFLLNDLCDKKYSKSYIDKIKIVLSSAFHYAVLQRWIDQSPIIKLAVPKKAPTKKVNALTVYQEHLVTNACKNERYGDITLFFLNSGLRASELFNLTFDDYFADEPARIIIRKSKTSSGERTVPLNINAQRIINRQPKVCKYIFTSSEGTQITSTIMSKHNKRIRDKTGLQDFTNHICRHTFATRALENGMNVKALSAILGHSTVEFTMSRYCTATIDWLSEQIKFMN